MRYLGIDYGSKRIGLALSDKEGKFAFPKDVLKNDGLANCVKAVSEMIEKEQVAEVVVGHSANFKGKDNPIMRSIRQFVDSLGREVQLPIHLEPEFMTSVQATRVTGKTEKIDAQAAALILQSYLDKLKSSSKS